MSDAALSLRPCLPYHHLEQPMPRRRRAVPLVVDTGPTILMPDAKGKLRPTLHPRLEVVHDAADPDAPNRTITRARVACHYDTAWRKGQISAAEREAADRYAITHDRAQGAQERQGGPTASSSPWERTPPLTALQAVASLTSAHKAIGNDAAALVTAYVAFNQPAEAIAQRRREDRKVTMGRIKAALHRLAEHWGMA